MLKKFCAVLFAFSAITANAAVFTQVMAGAQVTSPSQTTGWNPNSFYGNGAATQTQAAMLANGEANGWASTGPGYAKAKAEAYLYGAGQSHSVGATSYSDILNVSSQGLAGQTGRITVSFLLDYDMTVSAPWLESQLWFTGAIGNAIGSVAYRVMTNTDVNGQFLQGYFTKKDVFGQYEVRDTPVHAITLTSDFIFGQELGIYYNLQAEASASSAGHAISDASHSAYWGGIVEVTSNGQQIKDFSLTSASGADYSHSFAPSAAQVPEPTTIGLFVIGAIASARFSRRRKNIRK